MFESPEQQSESDPVESIDKLLLDAIRGVIYEPHEQHVEYEDEAMFEDFGGEQSGQSGGSGGGGGGMLPMLLVGVALGAVGYLYGKRSRSGGGSMGGTSEKIDDVAERTQEFAETTAETVRESGQEFSEQTEEKANRASERIEETTEQAGDRIEETGAEATDEMEDEN